MGIEFALIALGVAILVVVLARRRIFEKRLIDNRDRLAELRFKGSVPEEVNQILKKAPRLKGDGSFAYKGEGCILFAENFEKVMLQRRIYLIEPTEVEVFLIPEPANFERKLAVAITIDSLILGYVPVAEAEQMHKYLLAHSAGVKAKAKIYLGSRAEFNSIDLDLAKPLRLESTREKQG
jgi:hypothetical protein